MHIFMQVHHWRWPFFDGGHSLIYGFDGDTSVIAAELPFWLSIIVLKPDSCDLTVLENSYSEYFLIVYERKAEYLVFLKVTVN